MKTRGTDWLKQRGIRDERVLNAIDKVSRSDFVENGAAMLPEPEVVARMLEALHLEPDSNVLLVGTGSGYTAALLSRLATSVYTVERDADTAQDAAQRLAKLGYKNVQVLTGKTLRQYAAMAPYDGIMVSASLAKLPQRLAKRLGVNGALVAPVGKKSDQRLVRLTRLTETNFQEETLGELRVTPLLGEILVEMGVVERHEVEMAALEADVKGKRLGEALLEGQHVKEADIYKALSQQTGLRLVNAEEILRSMNRDLLHKYPRSFLFHNRILPLRKDGGMLHVATSDAGLETTDLAQSLGLQGVKAFLVPPSDFQLVWTSLERPAEPNIGAELGSGASVVLDEDGKLDADTIAFFQRIIVAAVEARASDVHFERHEQDVRVRFRVDGELLQPDEVGEGLDPEKLSGIVQLVKVSARMDSAQKRSPQSGHFQRRLGGRVFDIRARTQPTMYGETVVLRLLPQDAEILTLEELGPVESFGRELRQILRRPSGLVLVAGPAGSGRSTTIYAAVQAIAEDTRRKVVSVAHPVTYALPNVHQAKISPNYGFDVHDAIAAAMSDDADVILVGDISDDEVAHWAIKASQAGHLVLGAVHGRDSVDGIHRLHDYGIDASAISTELRAVIGQRLVRRNCEDCKVEVDVKELVGLPPAELEGLVAYRGEGCDTCQSRGTLGRIAVTELLKVDGPLREAISRRDSSSVASFRYDSLLADMKTMRQAALECVTEGTIPPEELQWMPTWD